MSVCVSVCVFVCVSVLNCTCNMCLQDEERSPTLDERSMTEEEQRFSLQESVVGTKAAVIYVIVENILAQPFILNCYRTV